MCRAQGSMEHLLLVSGAVIVAAIIIGLVVGTAISTNDVISQNIRDYLGSLVNGNLLSTPSASSQQIIFESQGNHDSFDGSLNLATGQLEIYNVQLGDFDHIEIESETIRISARDAACSPKGNNVSCNIKPAFREEENYKLSSGLHSIRLLSGNEVFKETPFEIAPAKYGDVSLDGQVTALDSSLILQYVAGAKDLSQDQLAAANVNFDEKVTILDSRIILAFTNGIVQALPDESLKYGDVSFDGQVTALDSSMVSQYLAKTEQLSQKAMLVADVDDDDQVTEKDACIILAYSTGSLPKLPASNCPLLRKCNSDHDCIAGEFCDLLNCNWHAVSPQGTCVKVPEYCTLEYNPVCGCDGKTYGNDCARLLNKVSKKNNNACEKLS